MSNCGGRIVCVHRRLDFSESFCAVDGLELDLRLFDDFMLHPLNTTEKNPYFVTGEPDGLFALPGCHWGAPLALFGKGSSGLLRRTLRGDVAPSRDCAEYAPTSIILAHACAWTLTQLAPLSRLTRTKPKPNLNQMKS